MRHGSDRTSEGFTDKRLVHDAYDRPFTVMQRDQRAPMQLSENEAPRAVDRIDHPSQRRCALRAPVLFAENAMGRISLLDRATYESLGQSIRFGHRVVVGFAALVLDVDRPPEMRQDRRSGRDGNAKSELEVIRVLGGRHRRTLPSF